MRLGAWFPHDKRGWFKQTGDMAQDVARLIEFYKSPLGRIARALVREQIIALSGNIAGQRILGLGFASPYLRFSLEKAERVLAFMPARQGASAWPREGPSHTVLCDPLEMPLTDAAVDLIVAVHAFEHIGDAEELMREIWRIAAPNAKLIVVVPRRRGLWAQRDKSAHERRARNLLGVAADAPREAIIEAHRRLIAQVHPDRGGSNEAVHEANAARDLLLERLGARNVG